jgi:hypothetical protein
VAAYGPPYAEVIAELARLDGYAHRSRSQDAAVSVLNEELAAPESADTCAEIERAQKVDHLRSVAGNPANGESGRRGFGDADRLVRPAGPVALLGVSGPAGVGAVVSANRWVSPGYQGRGARDESEEADDEEGEQAQSEAQ